MPLEEIPFGGLAALEADERVPVSQAIDATNCILDDATISGRNGYRNNSAGAVGSGTTQAIARYRFGQGAGGSSDANARTVVVRGGSIYTVSDASSETATDGAVSGATAAFGASANISAAQLGKYMYLASDVATDKMWRVKTDYTSEAITAIQKPVAPTVGYANLGVVLLNTLAAPSGTLTFGLAGSQPPFFTANGSSGQYVQWDVTASASVDWSGQAWLFVACTPSTQSGGGGNFRVEVVAAGGTVETLTEVYDTPGGDTPGCVYCALNQLSAATRAAVKSLRFTMASPTNNFLMGSYMLVPTAPSTGQVQYYLTYKDTVTGQESALSDAVLVTFAADAITFPSFKSYRGSYNSWYDNGSPSVNPDTMAPDFLFNKSRGKAYPRASELARTPQFTFTTPAISAGFGTFNQAVLYRVTATGTRQVKTLTVAASTTYTMIDDTGDATLTHASYLAGGPPPPATAIASRGGRLICAGNPANPHRVSISSYVPINVTGEGAGGTGDPFPQWPPVAVLDSDGWAFDLGQSAAEQILWMGNGDALYLLTNAALYSMNDLTPNSPPFRVFERGVIGRRAALWAEGSLHRVWGVEEKLETGAVFWAATDGIWTSYNRISAHELTKSIRRLYLSWFLPDSTTVIGYQDRKLYAVTGTRMLRYDFVTLTWTRHNLTHSMLHAAVWKDPTGSYQRLSFLESGGNVMRWQPGVSAADANRANTDAGSAIANWTYSTGFDVQPVKWRVKRMLADTTGTVSATAYKDTGTSTNPQAKSFTGGEHELAVAAYQAGDTTTKVAATGHKWRVVLSGANASVMKRLMWEREGIEAAHGG